VAMRPCGHQQGRRPECADGLAGVGTDAVRAGDRVVSASRVPLTGAGRASASSRKVPRHHGFTALTTIWSCSDGSSARPACFFTLGRSLCVTGLVVTTVTLLTDAGVVPEIFLPDEQMTIGFGIAVRASNLAGIPAAVRREMAAIDPGVPPYDVKTLREALADSISSQRFHLFLLGSFALAAFVLGQDPDLSADNLDSEDLVISGHSLPPGKPEDLAGRRSPNLQLLAVFIPKSQQCSLHRN
jgi:hypothetical protein